MRLENGVVWPKCIHSSATKLRRIGNLGRCLLFCVSVKVQEHLVWTFKSVGESDFKPGPSFLHFSFRNCNTSSLSWLTDEATWRVDIMSYVMMTHHWWDVFCLKNYKDISSLCSLLLQAIQKQIQTQIKYNSESVWKTTDASPPSLSVHFLSGDFCFPPPLCIFPVRNLPAVACATHISADDQVKNCCNADKCSFVQISCVATWISADLCR